MLPRCRALKFARKAHAVDRRRFWLRHQNDDLYGPDGHVVWELDDPIDRDIRQKA